MSILNPMALANNIDAITGLTVTGKAVAKAVDAATARTALGAASAADLAATAADLATEKTALRHRHVVYSAGGGGYPNGATKNLPSGMSAVYSQDNDFATITTNPNGAGIHISRSGLYTIDWHQVLTTNYAVVPSYIQLYYVGIPQSCMQAFVGMPVAAISLTTWIGGAVDLVFSVTQWNAVGATSPGAAQVDITRWEA